MNIPRRIKLLGAAGALSLASLTGLIAAAPAHALATAPHQATLTSYYTNYRTTYYTWWLPSVYLTPVPGSRCLQFNLSGYSADFANDSWVYVDLYENTNEGWQEIQTATADVTGGYLAPGSSVSWSGSLPYGEFGTGDYEAWLTDANGLGGAVAATCM